MGISHFDKIYANEYLNLNETTGRQYKISTTVGFSDADYIVDGVADNVQIQTVLDSMTTGGKLHIKGGTYGIAARLNIKYSNIEIELAPDAVLQATASLSSGSSFAIYKGLLHIENTLTGTSIDNVYIHGGTIDCNSQTETNALSIWGCGANAGAPSSLVWNTSNIRIENVNMINKANSTNAVSMVTILTGRVNATYFGRVKNVTFQGCQFDTGDMDMLSYYGSYMQSLKVIDCEFRNNDRHTIVQFGYERKTTGNVEIRNTKFIHTKLSIPSGSVCDFHDSAKTGGAVLTIDNCYFMNTGDGIVADAIAINCHGWEELHVTDSTFVDIWESISLGGSLAGTGWIQDGCTEVFITGNTFKRITVGNWDHDASYRIHVKNNTFIDIGFTGYSGYSKHDYAWVEGNLFYNCNSNIENTEILALIGLTPGTLSEHAKSAIESGGYDRVHIENNIVVDDRLLQDPGASVATLSQVAGGSLGARTYYVKITYANTTGETLPSTQQTISMSANNVLKVVLGVPAGYASTYSSIGGIRSVKIYVGTVSGSETLQTTLEYPNFNLTLNGWTEPTTGLVAGAALPVTNTTHALTKYGIYVLTGYTGAGQNVYANNHFYGVSTAGITGNGTDDKSLQYGNTLNDVLLPSTASSLAYAAKTATYTITNTDYTIDCTANTFTVTLPTAIGIAGRIFIIKNSGVGTITVATTGGQTIDGSATATLAVQYGSITVQSTNANWVII